jgi:antitoxin ParD1/3/4
MPTRTDPYDHFEAEQIESGKYHNASEVMRAGLRLLEQPIGEEQQKLNLLRALAEEGFGQLDQGQGIELRGERQLASFIRRIGQRTTKTTRRRSNGD